MSSGVQYRVRPFSRPARTDYKDVFRVYLSRPALVSLKLEPGDACVLVVQRTSDEQPATRPAIAWNAAEKIQDNVVQTSKSLQELYGLRLEDRISIERAEAGIAESARIVVKEVSIEESEALNDTEKSNWEWYLEWVFERAEMVGIGLRIDVELRGQHRQFVVENTGSQSIAQLCRVTSRTKVSIGSGGLGPPTRSVLQSLSSEGIGGIERQITQINRFLRRLVPSRSLPSFYTPFQGLLIYGPKGTGKTLIIEKLTKCGWQTVLRLAADSDRMDWTKLPQRGPALIVIEQVEQIAPRRGLPDRQSTAPRVRNIFDTISGCQVLVVAETRHPNDIDETLRAPGRFGVEIELPIPNAKDRGQILRAIRGDSSEPNGDLLDDVALRTHGYVGSDLFALLNTAVDIALDREEHEASIEPSGSRDMNGSTPQTNGDLSTAGSAGNGGDKRGSSPIANDIEPRPGILSIEASDFHKALLTVRPTAMQEVFLETPHVHWSSIGGLHETKRRLQNAVERPLKKADLMARLGQQPTKGILLYGPPGCSKTMLVKALATEASLNFLAVKGAEVVSMYVGESERAVREIFRKARAASPSIIFFDEIDAIASDRRGKGGAGELNVLTTLLNEMDGFEELRNVLVVAATNKPESIDPAMMRPGRFDKIVYVGLPDLEARREILQLRFDKSNVQADAWEVASITDGYSGAELISICQTAGEYALDEDRGLITREDLAKALTNTPKGISWEMLQDYEHWHRA